MKKAVVLSLSNDRIELIREGEITAFIKKTKPEVEEPFVCYLYSQEDKEIVCAFEVTVKKYNPIYSCICEIDKERFELVCKNYAGLRDGEISQFLRNGAFIWNVQANTLMEIEPVKVETISLNHDDWGYIAVSDEKGISLTPFVSFVEWTVYQGSDGNYYVYDLDRYGDELKEVVLVQKRENHHEWNLFQQKTPVSFGGDYDGETDDTRFLVSFRLKGEKDNGKFMYVHDENRWQKRKC